MPFEPAFVDARRGKIHPDAVIKDYEGELVTVLVDGCICGFLTDDRRCAIYDERPRTCRKFGDETDPMLTCTFQDRNGRVRSDEERKIIGGMLDHCVDHAKAILLGPGSGFDCRPYIEKCKAQCCGACPLPIEVVRKHLDLLPKGTKATRFNGDHLYVYRLVDDPEFGPTMECAFNDPDTRLCMIYEDRSLICRQYPTDQEPLASCEWQTRDGTPRSRQERRRIARERRKDGFKMVPELKKRVGDDVTVIMQDREKRVEL